eukprot:NODE_5241_length_292_cov_5.839506_g5158_i0.p2 GENE.NODE_5241_length_292_cov_5.839506_g5158_i0~~NODE_5241_length_292_cov_5.839506_g5158_i0.p2  ORF type:complete len:52 (+),score=1.67 NODE_5241_length_292_cov_5.839506_g5158_i0:91-246(+)
MEGDPRAERHAESNAGMQFRMPTCRRHAEPHARHAEGNVGMNSSEIPFTVE